MDNLLLYLYDKLFSNKLPIKQRDIIITIVDKPKIKYRRFTYKVNSLVVDKFLVCSKTNKEKHIDKSINQSNEK